MKIKLKEVRQARNLSLRDLEKITGISKTELNNIENGRVIPRLDVYCKISRALNLDCAGDLCDCDRTIKD
jgi:transcriptional regulator with XRE-family HTH domain